MAIFDYGGIKKLSRCFLIFISAGFVAPCANAAGSKVDPAIQQAVIDYLEQQLPTSYPDAKNFVAVDFFGSSTHGETTKIYGFYAQQRFAVIDDEVIDRGGSWVPVVVFAEKAETGFKVTGYQEAEDGGAYWPSIERMFPLKFQELAGHLPKEREKKLDEQIRSRVIPYYRELLKTARYVQKPKPSNLFDPHKHKEDIYNYRNLEVPYRKISIVANPVKVERTGGGKPIDSPDGRFTAWQGGNFQVYFEDRATATVFEVVNQTYYDQYELAWKGDHILVFDQQNGVNRIGDWETEGVRYGVHIELDAEKREIIWAVPFGILGFPQKQ